MSRLVKYKESLNKFIKDRSCLFDNTINSDQTINNILYNELKNCDLTLSILLLTIMNSQNKKNQISLQGYYAASTIQYIHLLLNIMEKKTEYITKYGHEVYSKLINIILLGSNKSLCQNLDSIKNIINNDIVISKIYTNILNVYHEEINYECILNDYAFDITTKKCNNDIVKWYIKDNDKYKEQFSKFVQINRESFNNYINKKIGSLCELTFCIGWYIGCGDEKNINTIKKISKYFTMLLKLSYDFKNLDKDIMSNSLLTEEKSNNITINYVLNYGLQDSYELFMYNKQKFIEECMMQDIYTNTIKEIMNFIEKDVDDIIDQTSPDLKSNFTQTSEV
jgi:hypothetical protein